MLITTKFLGPTEMKGARVKAISASGKSKTMDAFDAESDHRIVADALAKQMIDKGACKPDLWIRRWNKDGSCVHVGIYNDELKG